jgi:hypothetical protein
MELFDEDKLTEEDFDDLHAYDDYPAQEEPNCDACADSRYVTVRWPRWLRWFRPNHSWNCPWCNQTRLDRLLNIVTYPAWRARYRLDRLIRRNKPDDEAPF